jgi:hypothetical protein
MARAAAFTLVLAVRDALASLLQLGLLLLAWGEPPRDVRGEGDTKLLVLPLVPRLSPPKRCAREAMEPPGDSAETAAAADCSSEDEDVRRGVTPAAAAAAAGTALCAEDVDLSWTLLKAAAVGEGGAAVPAAAAALCLGLSGGVLMPGLVLNLPASKDTEGFELTAVGAAGAACAGAAGATAAGAEGDCCLGAGGGGGESSLSSSSLATVREEATPGDDLKREAEVTVCGLHRPTLARSPAKYASRVPSRWALSKPEGS